MAGSGARVPIFLANLEVIEEFITYKNKEYTLKFFRTKYGEFLVQTTNGLAILMGKSAKAACTHFAKVVGRCPLLDHGGLQLRDHIEVNVKYVIITMILKL